MAQETLQVIDLFGKTKPIVNTPVIPTNPTIKNNAPPHDPTSLTNIQQRNTSFIKEVNELEVQKEIQKQSDILMLTHNGFPMQSDNVGTSNYYKAFIEIQKMLTGEQSLNLGKAIFLVENAYYDNTYKYEDYQNTIKDIAELCNNKIEEDNLDKNDNLVKNMMIFRFISDTLIMKDKNTGKKLYHYPVKYNYEDYHSQNSFDSHFVTTLMHTGKGQCYSMPLYYLILAEEMGAEAYWSFSPRHTFVKIQDNEGKWYNIELTCKGVLSDAHYMNNSYIKAEALQNKIYLDPMDKTNIVAQMLIELARGYYHKYGLDDFYLQCADTAMKYLDNDLDALMLKSEYQTRLTLTLAQLLNAPKPEDMNRKSPEAYKHFELMQEFYRQIDNLGYEELPEDLYARWLDYIEKEKAKSEKLPSIFIPKKGG